MSCVAAWPRSPFLLVGVPAVSCSARADGCLQESMQSEATSQVTGASPTPRPLGPLGLAQLQSCGPQSLSELFGRRCPFSLAVS